MKTTFATLSSLVISLTSVNAAAATLPIEDHKQLLQSLLGSRAPTNAQELRTYFFANENAVITVENTRDNISVTVSPSENGESLEFYMSASKNSASSYKFAENHQLQLNYIEYTNVNGAQTKYSEVNINMTSFSSATQPELTAQATETLYCKFGAPCAVAKNAPKGNPPADSEVRKANVYLAGFVLSLSPEDMGKMGEMARNKVSETRAPTLVECRMTSEFLVKCDYSLETDYTADTLHSTFSVKDGNISELLEADIEPGC